MLSAKGRAKKKARRRDKLAQIAAFARLAPEMQRKIVAGLKVAADRIQREQRI